MNDYDKASRYLAKRHPSGFFPWLLAGPVAFHAWIDARRVALPDQHDLTNDLVAALEKDGVPEAICLELEAEARADAVTRVLGYVLRIWTEPEGEGSLPVRCVSGVILDLTGRSPTKELILRSKIVAGCEWKFTVLRRSLADEGRDCAHTRRGVRRNLPLAFGLGSTDAAWRRIRYNCTLAEGRGAPLSRPARPSRRWLAGSGAGDVGRLSSRMGMWFARMEHENLTVSGRNPGRRP